MLKIMRHNLPGPIGQALSSDTVCTVQYTAVRTHTAA